MKLFQNKMTSHNPRWYISILIRPGKDHYIHHHCKGFHHHKIPYMPSPTFHSRTSLSILIEGNSQCACIPIQTRSCSSMSTRQKVGFRYHHTTLPVQVRNSRSHIFEKELPRCIWSPGRILHKCSHLLVGKKKNTHHNFMCYYHHSLLPNSVPKFHCHNSLRSSCT